jgi:hypothetical protein
MLKRILNFKFFLEDAENVENNTNTSRTYLFYSFLYIENI